MKTIQPTQAWHGECEGEICLPVRVRYRVDADGEVEVTQVVLAETACLPAETRLHWMRLPLAERHALDELARLDVGKLSRSSHDADL